MLPLIAAVAIGAAKFNQQRFVDLLDSWKIQRAGTTICSQIDASWYLEHMATHRDFGANAGDRAALVGRFRALQGAKDACLQQLIAFQGELPFLRSPGEILTKVRECWALRSQFQELNRELNSAPYRGQALLLRGSPDSAVRQWQPVELTAVSNSTFLAQTATRCADP